MNTNTSALHTTEKALPLAAGRWGLDATWDWPT
jgi:hypothetical protein